MPCWWCSMLFPTCLGCYCYNNCVSLQKCRVFKIKLHIGCLFMPLENILSLMVFHACVLLTVREPKR